MLQKEQRKNNRTFSISQHNGSGEPNEILMFSLMKPTQVTNIMLPKYANINISPRSLPEHPTYKGEVGDLMLHNHEAA